MSDDIRYEVSRVLSELDDIKRRELSEIKSLLREILENLKRTQ